MKRRYELFTYIVTIAAFAVMTALAEYGVMVYIAARF